MSNSDNLCSVQYISYCNACKPNGYSAHQCHRNSGMKGTNKYACKPYGYSAHNRSQYSYRHNDGKQVLMDYTSTSTNDIERKSRCDLINLTDEISIVDLDANETNLPSTNDKSIIDTQTVGKLKPTTHASKTNYGSSSEDSLSVSLASIDTQTLIKSKLTTHSSKTDYGRSSKDSLSVSSVSSCDTTIKMRLPKKRKTASRVSIEIKKDHHKKRNIRRKTIEKRV